MSMFFAVSRLAVVSRALRFARLDRLPVGVALIGVVALAVFAAPRDIVRPAQAQEPAKPVEGGVDEQYDLKLRDLETRVNEVKEMIFRSKQRLALLSERMQAGRSIDAKIVVKFTNKMTDWFNLEEIVIVLDGAEIARKSVKEGDSSLSDLRDFQVYASSMAPGDHLITAQLIYRGESAVFTYLRGLRVRVAEYYSFSVDSGKQATVTVTGYDRSNAEMLQERPAIRFDSKSEDMTDEPTKR